MESPLKKADILIIDDELPLCLSIRELLNLEGYDAGYVLSVPEGYAFLAANSETDIVLLDIHFDSGPGGREALPLIKEKYPYIQIIMLTSENSIDSGVECMKLGAYDYIIKPIEETVFFEKIAGAVEKRNLDKLKDLYYRIIVHDFKKPLQGISMAVESLLLKNNDTRTPGESRFLGIAQYGCWQLNNMMGNILNVARFEEQGVPLRFESFDLNKEIRIQLKIICDTIVLYEKEYEIIPLPGPSYQVKTDKELFFRILTNLIDNAHNHTPAGSKITVRLRETSDGDIHVSVTNQGSYIEEELREKIFEKFYKVHSAGDYGKSNFGLGLTFCKLAVTMLKGRIWVESDREHNETVFHFIVKNRDKE